SAAAPASVSESIESAKAAMAAAIMPHNSPEVTIRPLGPKPSLFVDPAAAAPEPDEPDEFIPPQPERVPPRALRMPRIDELPMPAQNEIRAQRGEVASDEHPQKQRMSLLQRLASVGLGRREHDEDEPVAPPMSRGMPGGPLPAAERLPGRPLPRTEPVSDYAK